MQPGVSLAKEVCDAQRCRVDQGPAGDGCRAAEDEALEVELALPASAWIEPRKLFDRALYKQVPTAARLLQAVIDRSPWCPVSITRVSW